MKCLVFVLFLIGCSDKCVVNDMQCDDNVVEICMSNHNWDEIMDCNDLEIPDAGVSRCGMDTEEDVYTCLF